MSVEVLGHRLVIDIQTTQSPLFSERGIPRYTGDYARALLAAGAPVAGLMLNPTLPYPRRLHSDVTGSPEVRWNTAQAFRALTERGPVLYHIMSSLESPRPVQATLPPFVMGAGMPLVFTVYDMIPEILKVFEPGSAFERLYNMRRAMLQRADLLFAISRSTRDDAIRLLGADPDCVVEIGTGGSAFFHPPAPGDRPADVVAQHVPAVDRPYVLTVTGAFGLDHRKNTDGVIAAFASLPRHLRNAHQLVVACTLNDGDRVRWQALAREHGLTESQLVLTDFVADVALRALYQRASLFVNASLYEGFGLPALEAARCACPTITSNTSSLPEILDWAPATFDPASREEMSTVMERALLDEDFRRGLREAAARASVTHTWENVAAKAMAGYARLDPPRRRRPSRSTPLRIALVGPFPPGSSGSAVFNERLAGSLAGRCELDCFVDGPYDRPEAAGRRFRMFPASAFGQFLSPYSYDAVFYTLADDPCHIGTYELSLTYPGIVWLHDLHIAGLFLAFSQARFDDAGAREFMFNTLRGHYGARAPEFLIDHWATSTSAAFQEAGARLGAAAAMRSRGVIVGSRAARSLLDTDAGPFPRLPPAWVVPFPAPDAGAGPPAGLGVSDRRLVVLGLGGVRPAVRPELLVEAMADVVGRIDARLVILGDVEPACELQLQRRIAKLGMQDHVEVVGHVPSPAYTAWMRQAACAVHLGVDRSGATSLAVSEAMAHGLPVITTLPAYFELPPGTVRVLPSDVRAVALAAEITGLVGGTAEAERLARGARAYSKTYTFDDVANRVIEIARESAFQLTAR